MLFADPVEEWKWHVRKRIADQRYASRGRPSRRPKPFRSPRRFAPSIVLLPIAAFSATAGLLVRSPLRPFLLVLAALGAARALGNVFKELSDARSGVDGLIARAEQHLRHGDYHTSATIAQRALGIALTTHRRDTLHTTLAWAGIGKHDPFLAHGALLELPSRAIDLNLLAAYLNCCNRTHEAARLLEEARPQ